MLGFCVSAAGFAAWWTMIRMPGESFSGESPPAPETELKRADELRRDVEHLAVTIGERNLQSYPRLVQAAAFIEQEFRKAGYEVARQEYEVLGMKCHNIEVEIRGAERPDQIVIVGGHYDSVAGTPGANDNASGAAATLALARHFAGSQPARTLRFVAFVNEEPPYFQRDSMGSLVYARRCKQRNENVVAVLALETMGYYTDEPNSQKYPPVVGALFPSEGNFIGVVGNVGSRQLVRDVVQAFRANTKFPCEGASLPGHVTGVGWSDHWSFWQEGYPGVMITDTALFRYPYYHQAKDTPDKIDFQKMARVVDGLEQVIDSLTDSKTVPKQTSPDTDTAPKKIRSKTSSR
jgi:Zn-dependent M28 family amino/carboxypeptidase